jgi:purine catabolism regulator
VAITVGDLVEIPHLGTRVYAGNGGLDREIRWAHACEMQAPWEWLGEGDLLLTSGMGLPPDPVQQVDYLRRLGDAGISGIAIGEWDGAPPVSTHMAHAADRERLPVLVTAYEVPWVAVARAVLDANGREEQARVLKMAGLYERVREASVESRPAGDLLHALGDDLACRLTVYGNERPRRLLPGTLDISPQLLQSLTAAVEAHGGLMPAAVRIAAGDEQALLVPVPTSRPSSLVVLANAPSAVPDLVLLQHVATVVAIEIERSTAERAQRLRLGAELFAELLDAQIDPALVARRLGEHGFAAQRLVLAAWALGGVLSADDLQDALADAGIAHLLLRREDCTFTLLPEGVDLEAELKPLLPPESRIGVSAAFERPARAADAMRQARWALQAAQSGSGLLVTYGDAQPYFLPRTLAEAQHAVERTLGTLMAYDRRHNADLVETLRIFLLCNRSWKRASEQLYVHKQTLVYRVRRIEELTGRRLDETEHVAELWLALRALELTVGAP